MKTLRLFIGLCLIFMSISARAQVSTWAQGFDRSVNSASARAYLGIGTNGTSGVSFFSADPLAGLFDVTVLTPSTTPHLQFSFQSQSANLVLASPAGSPGAPSFRSLSAGDLPALPYVNTITNAGRGAGDVTLLTTSNSPNPSLKALNPGTGISLTDRGTDVVINATSSGSLTSITNADWATTPPDVSLITTSNPPVPSLKGLKAGGNVTLTDNGTSITIAAANSGGGASGVDLSQTNMPAFDGATNFYVDFTWPAQVLSATGAIYFNYATNWGLANTSRVANIYIAPTNYYRPIYLINAATNWHTQRPIYAVPTGYGAKISFQVFGQGNTNVAYNALIDNFITGTNGLNINGFNPTNSQGGCVLWMDASYNNGIFQDELLTTPIADGQPIRAAIDMSGFVGKLTNGSSTCFLYYRTPNSSPFNIPSYHFTPSGPAWLVSTQFSNLAQPNWCFIMYYGRGTGLSFVDGLSEGNRFACIPSESTFLNIQLYSGTGLNVASTPLIGWRLFSFEQNSTTSIIRTNGVQAISGNSGTQTPARWIVGSDYPFSNFTGNIWMGEVLIYHTNLTAQQVTNIESYFRAKYPLQ